MFAEADIFLLYVRSLPIPNLVPRAGDGVDSKFLLNPALGVMESIVTPYVNLDLRKTLYTTATDEPSDTTL
jgi:hypothetical protein